MQKFLVGATIRSTFLSSKCTMIKDVGAYAQYLAGPSLLLPNNKQFAVDVKRLEGTMAAISDRPIKRVNPAVIIDISPIRSSQSAGL